MSETPRKLSEFEIDNLRDVAFGIRLNANNITLFVRDADRVDDAVVRLAYLEAQAEQIRNELLRLRDVVDECDVEVIDRVLGAER